MFNINHLMTLPVAALLLVAAPSPAAAQSPLTYADLADLALAAPVVAQIELRRAVAVRRDQAIGVRAGYSRYYVEANVLALIRGAAGTPSALRYVVDLPNDAAGRAVRPARRSQWLVFASEVRGRPGELRLVAADAHVPFTPALAERVRAVLTAGTAADAPPALTAIGRAFHVPGALPGTGETQIFLQTSGGQPVSLTVVREAGVGPRWSVSLSEFVDAGAARPQRDTLLWYRLACFLPRELPPASVADAAGQEAGLAADYQVVLDDLGECPRSRRR